MRQFHVLTWLLSGLLATSLLVADLLTPYKGLYCGIADRQGVNAAARAGSAGAGATTLFCYLRALLLNRRKPDGGKHPRGFTRWLSS
jgi:hypothetical protein